ncbi:hypothetical protein G436_2137 [Leptospira interrogans serovar Hardjo str. Norma]|uniref:Uncharacterized protein n=1 Tax=Leptospira interrogans serovar Hardjo str. Norma TaxID=1279460 RepID=A0A0M4MTV9_LEPIR|nr:hypothetical protein G436_2137 [Leptospira interrogans serovar Hardjo str. Norma]
MICKNCDLWELLHHYIDNLKFCGSSHILRIDLQSPDSNFFRKMNTDFLHQTRVK